LLESAQTLFGGVLQVTPTQGSPLQLSFEQPAGHACFCEA
jgi:hypothetical protein